MTQVNEGLSEDVRQDKKDKLDYSMRQELEQVLKVGQRIALCMAKYELYLPFNLLCCLKLRITSRGNSFLCSRDAAFLCSFQTSHFNKRLRWLKLDPGGYRYYCFANRLAAAANAHLLQKALKQKLWDGSSYQCR